MYALIELETIDSTNDWAKREKASFSPDHPTFIVASGQTHGRGRGTNTWISPTGQNLYLTVAEKVRRPLTITDYALIAPLAIKRLLDSFGVRANIKWPNDLVVDRGLGPEKICGILVEGTSVGNDPWAIIGIGLNVRMDESLLCSIDQPATSLHRLLPHPPTVQEVKQRAIEVICESLLLAQNNPTACREEFCEACGWLIGATASVLTPQETLKGTIESFTSEGYLRLLAESKRSVVIPQGVLTLF